MMCFVGPRHVFELLAWKGRGFEFTMVDIADIGVEPNSIDAAGHTTALFDTYIGIEDARVASLIGLMRSEIEDRCPSGGAYGDALSLALGSRVAWLCGVAPARQRRVATLSSKRLLRVPNPVRAKAHASSPPSVSQR
jgi:hypothetical protein